MSGSIRVGSLGDEASSDPGNFVDDGVSANLFDDADEKEFVGL